MCILSMKYGLNALRDFMDFIPSFCRTQNVVKNISSNRLTCVSPLGMRSYNRTGHKSRRAVIREFSNKILLIVSYKMNCKACQHYRSLKMPAKKIPLNDL